MVGDTLELNIQHLLMDYRLLARAIMEMHARTGHILAQATQAEAAAHKAQLGGPSKAARAEELAGRAGRLREMADRAERNNEESVRELQQQRISDFKQALVVYAVNNMEVAAAEMQLWRSALESLQELRAELLEEENREEEEDNEQSAAAAAEGGDDAAGRAGDAPPGSLMSF